MNRHTVFCSFKSEHAFVNFFLLCFYFFSPPISQYSPLSSQEDSKIESSSFQGNKDAHILIRNRDYSSKVGWAFDVNQEKLHA